MSNPICNSMPPDKDLGANENGFVLVTTLLLMLLLLLAGLAATNSTITELQIAANDREYKRNFYRAEGAAMESAQRLENENDTEELAPKTTSQRWLSSNVDLTDPRNWQERNGQPWNFRAAALADEGSNVRLAAVYLKKIRSLKSQNDQTKVHEYLLFGRSDRGNSRVLIEIRYKKRF